MPAASEFVQAFIDRYGELPEGEFPEFPGYEDPSEAMGYRVDRQFRIELRDAVAWLALAVDGAGVEIAWISVEPRGQGHGDAVMRALVAEADARGVTLKAIPSGREPGLIRYYARYGFVNTGNWLVRKATR